MIIEWKKQFTKEKMRPSDIMKCIVESKDSGDMFKLNFLVLFLIYVHSTICTEVEVDHKLLPLHAWTMDLLRQRHKTGHRKGGLHMAELIQDGMRPPHEVDGASDHQIVELRIQNMDTIEVELPEQQKDEHQGSKDPSNEDNIAYDEEELRKAIIEKSTESSKERTTAITLECASNSATKECMSNAMGAQHHITQTLEPNFNIGFSLITDNPCEQIKAKGKVTMTEDDCQPKANRREVKLGDLMRSP
ncbi:hypothetical protein L6452_02087 [Arctium lappa]|uniref:Uncharacterized protein n=1 Tax=Arctium lappa TaxID=4217 RepID=A0ACB9FI46_ARCLA|nr:hypothetical protein L6452_02087 [Arctium lappa]